MVRLYLHRRPAGPGAEGEDPCPVTQDIAADLAYVLPRLGQITRGWANFKYAVAKWTFSKLDAFTWWRLARTLRPAIAGTGVSSAAS